jgi:hypothetical protein
MRTSKCLKRGCEILAIFKKRYTAQELTQLFVLCAFPIHIWTIVNTLRDVPTWILYLNGWEVAGAFAYTLSFALFETVVLYIAILLLGMLVPERWRGDQYVPLASVYLLELSVMAGILQFFLVEGSALRGLILTCVIILFLTPFLIIKAKRLTGFVSAMAGRLSLLAYIYTFFDVVGLVIVIARNVSVNL